MIQLMQEQSWKSVDDLALVSLMKDNDSVVAGENEFVVSVAGAVIGPGFVRDCLSCFGTEAFVESMA